MPDDPGAHAALVAAILQEARRGPLPEQLDTLYIGGGTPALLREPQLAELLNGLRSVSRPGPALEITLEANPSNVTLDSLGMWSDLGITRVSVGVQTFRDDVLRRLGRHDSAARAHAALADLQQHWRGSWSADLLVGWEGQDDREVEADVEALLSHSPPHISVYGLTVEPGTALAEWQRLGRAVAVSAAAGERFDDIWSERLVAAGLERYEVSNFACKGHRSSHNRSYWRNLDYIGLGPSAASSSHPLRWVNRADPESYRDSITRRISARQFAERVAPLARLLESLALGLRTAEGFSVPSADARFTPAWRDLLHALAPDLLQQSLLTLDESALRAGHDGSDVIRADALAAELARRLSRTNSTEPTAAPR